jgi:hypothetical protein
MIIARSKWTRIRELPTITLEVLTSSGYFARMRHAELGADRAAELGSLLIYEFHYYHHRNLKLYRFTHLRVISINLRR